MKPLKLLPFKKCTCGHDLKANEVYWKGRQEGVKFDFNLYNCPKCGTTGTVRVKTKTKEAA